MRLMTNNPAEYVGLKGYGLEITEKVPLFTPIIEETTRHVELGGSKGKFLHPNNGQLSL